MSWNTINAAMKELSKGCKRALVHQDMIKKITDMKFELPRQSEEPNLAILDL